MGKRPPHRLVNKTAANVVTFQTFLVLLDLPGLVPILDPGPVRWVNSQPQNHYLQGQCTKLPAVTVDTFQICVEWDLPELACGTRPSRVR